MSLICFGANAQTQTDAPQETSTEELAKKLANPVSFLINVPFQNNFDFNVDPFDGFRYSLNMQPVVPISISEKWNVISRTIIPVISQSDVTTPNSSETGLGDIPQSIFFSPKEVENGFVWGVGPVFFVPSAGLFTSIVIGIVSRFLAGSLLVWVNSQLFRKKSFKFAMLTTFAAYTLIFILVLVLGSFALIASEYGLAGISVDSMSKNLAPLLVLSIIT